MRSSDEPHWTRERRVRGKESKMRERSGFERNRDHPGRHVTESRYFRSHAVYNSLEEEEINTYLKYFSILWSKEG